METKMGEANTLIQDLRLGLGERDVTKLIQEEYECTNELMDR